MKRLILLLAACLWPALVSAQGVQQVPWSGVTLPTFVLPASAVSGGGSVSASLIPAVDNTYDLGSSALRWRNIYWGTQALAPNGSASAPSYSFANDPESGMYLGGDGAVDFSANTAAIARMSSSGAFVLGATRSLQWGSSGFSTPDVSLSRGAPNVVKIGTGANKLAIQTPATAPTCTSNCGTSPSVAGNDTAFRVTMGATGVPASGWVITFNGTWSANPVCQVSMGKAGMVVGKTALTTVTSTTTMTVVTNGTAPANSDVYDVVCFGIQ